jgi:transcriptional regulator with XRE-family HTH domain
MSPKPKGMNAQATAKDQSHSIGYAINARRRQLGLTLRQLAAKADLSAPFISQAERGLTTPSIISLIHLADALGVDIHYFIDVPKGRRMVRRADDPEYINTGSPIRYIRLSGGLDDQKMEALIVTVPPKLELPTVRREGEGFYYILNGTVRFEIGDDTFVLKTGDSAHFDQRLRYTMVNEGDSDAVSLWVGTPPLFEVKQE